MDKFLIAPFESGLQKGATPFLEPKDAFSKLNNAYVFRGKLKKRFGSTYSGIPDSEKIAQLSSRLRINIGNTDGTGNLTATVLPGTIFKEGQILSVGEDIFTIIDVSAGTHALNTTRAAATGTFTETTKTVVISTSEPNKICWFYPSDPVMGLTMFESSSYNNHDTIAFDTQFAYSFSGTYWSRLGTAIWTGDNYDYFWTVNADGATQSDSCLYVTNFKEADGLKYYDGTNWHNWTPKYISATPATDNIIKTAKIIVQYKDRILLLSTVEFDGTNNLTHVNRCRYSWNGSPLSASSWLEPNQDSAGGAGYIDAPTEEEIVSAEFIKDSLIVYFENSTYLLAYTGNEVLPFVWRKINNELGSQSTFSSIPFDDQILTVGLTGIHSCNGSSVKRMDENIPDDVFQILNDSQQVKRVHGIIDYISQVVYWSLPKINADDTNSFPDKVLVYNYKNGTWAYNDDCITTFGYFEQEAGLTWENDFSTWEEDDSTWESGYSLSNTKQIIGGNQHGFVFLIKPELQVNSSSLQIGKIDGATNDELYVESHNLSSGEFVRIKFYDLTTFIGKVTVVDDNNINVFGGSTNHDERYYYSDVDYKGGATIERISKIDIQSTLWNPYLDSGSNVSLSKISFCVQKTSKGLISVDNTVSSAEGLSMYQEGINSGAILGSNILETSAYDSVPMELMQDRVWHSMYFSANGEFVRLRIYLSDEQLYDYSVVSSAFVIEAMILETSRKGVL